MTLKELIAGAELESERRRKAKEAAAVALKSGSMQECLKVQSGGCHSDDQVCPNYLSQNVSAKCKDWLKYVYPDKYTAAKFSTPEARAVFSGDRTDTEMDTWDNAKQAMCSEPENMNYEFCSCLARRNPDSKWNKGEVGFKALLAALLDTKDPEQCWYNPCYSAGRLDHLGTGSTATVMTMGKLTQDPKLGGQKCVNNAVCRFNMNSFGNSKIEAKKLLVNCNINQDAPDAPPASTRNLLPFVAAALVSLVLLVLLLRRLFR